MHQFQNNPREKGICIEAMYKMQFLAEQVSYIGDAKSY